MKNNFSFTYLLLSHFVVFFILLSCSSEQDNKNIEDLETPIEREKIEYTEQIPILAWIGVPPNADISHYNTLRSAGFTHDLMTFFGNADAIQEGLDKAQRAGIKGIINCPELHTDTETTINRFKNHPALAGYTVMDEPRMRTLDAAEDKMRKFQLYDKKGISYVNLLSASVDESFLQGLFKDYFKKATTQLPLQMLSFTYYPIRILDGKMKKELNPRWYESLEIFSKKAQELKIPLWTFALSSEHHHGTAFYPEPTISDLRLQVYSNLAYGSQMIQYYTYWQPRDALDYKAPVNADGSKNIAFNRLKTMNEEIIKLSGVFVGVEKIDVWHTGSELPIGTKALVLPEAFELIETKGDGAVISLLKNDNRNYLMIVNRSIDNHLILDIKAKHYVQEVDKEAYLNTVKWGTPKEYKLEPGDMKLFHWK